MTYCETSLGAKMLTALEELDASHIRTPSCSWTLPRQIRQSVTASPLHRAIHNSSSVASLKALLEALEVLLELGADPTLMDPGRWPLARAVDFIKHRKSVNPQARHNNENSTRGCARFNCTSGMCVCVCHCSCNGRPHANSFMTLTWGIC
jgi:hypothetical protein